jgi:hypothetical protein
MARLLTFVDEALASAEPPAPFTWFHSFGRPEELARGTDRFLLFLGFDADRKENTVKRMLLWFDDFQCKLSKVDPQRFAAMVFVLDWPHEPGTQDSRAKLTDEDVDRLMQAGICYRPKDKRFYTRRAGGLAEALRRDLLEKHLIPQHPEEELQESVAPRSTPDEQNPDVREALEFLGSPQFVWPADAVRELFRR